MSIEVQSYYVDLKIKNSKAVNRFFYYKNMFIQGPVQNRLTTQDIYCSIYFGNHPISLHPLDEGALTLKH